MFSPPELIKQDVPTSSKFIRYPNNESEQFQNCSSSLRLPSRSRILSQSKRRKHLVGCIHRTSSSIAVNKPLWHFPLCATSIPYLKCSQVFLKVLAGNFDISSLDVFNTSKTGNSQVAPDYTVLATVFLSRKQNCPENSS